MQRLVLLQLALWLAPVRAEGTLTATLEARTAPDAPATPQELVLAGMERARWRCELDAEREGARSRTRILYLDGERVLEFVTGRESSRALEAEEARVERAGFAVLQGLLLAPERVAWRDHEDERVAELSLGRLIAAPRLRPSVVRLEHDGQVLASLRAIRWSEPEQGLPARPLEARLEREGRPPLFLRVIAVDAKLEYVPAFFLPPDRREEPSAERGFDARVERVRLEECRERRIPLPAGTSWEQALARDERLRAEHARSLPQRPLSPARLLELDARGLPRAVVLRLDSAREPVPGFELRAPAEALTLLLPALESLGPASLLRLRAGLTQNERGVEFVVRLPQHAPGVPLGRVQLLLRLERTEQPGEEGRSRSTGGPGRESRGEGRDRSHEQAGASASRPQPREAPTGASLESGASAGAECAPTASR